MTTRAQEPETRAVSVGARPLQAGRAAPPAMAGLGPGATAAHVQSANAGRTMPEARSRRKPRCKFPASVPLRRTRRLRAQASGKRPTSREKTSLTGSHPPGSATAGTSGSGSPRPPRSSLTAICSTSKYVRLSSAPAKRSENKAGRGGWDGKTVGRQRLRCL